MTWTPANISASCQLHPSVPTCQISILAFVTLLTQQFSHSKDKYFTDNKQNENIKDNEEYDFIVVGAGSTGCVVANRLTEINEWKVLLLEAGGEEPLVSAIPGVYRLLSGSSIDWNYHSQPEPVACHDQENKACHLPRGKVMGGSSTINGMAYVRGNPKIYDEWAKLGGIGWSYKDVLPYFLKSEDNRIRSLVRENPEYHSTGGYETVEEFPVVDNNGHIVLDAWKELGLHQVDYNAKHRIGVSPFQANLINGARQSSNGGFLRPIRGRRPNLVVRTHSHVTKILIDPATKRAFGVEYSLNGDKDNLMKAYAKKEVILSAGVFDSPKLLMLSGIGHAEELDDAGINLIADLAVGDNLHDHVLMPSSVALLSNTSTVGSIDEMINDAIHWFSSHEGTFSSIGGASSITTFTQTMYEELNGVPDIQVHHYNAMIEDIESSKSFNGLPSYFPVSYYNAITLNPVILNPKSRGTVRLNKTDPIWSQPVIKINYLTDPQDLRTLVNGASIVKRLFGTRAFRKNCIEKYTKSAEACKNYKFESPRYFECIARNYAVPGLHLVGTCKMGPQNDSSAVVDPELKVYGIEGLRIADASVIPIIPAGNTHATAVMIGEKAADMIKNYYKIS